MKTKLTSLLLIAFLSLLFSACLTVEGREYRIKLNDDKSGSATIKFINIMSEADDTVDISEDDFQELMSAYVGGDNPEKDFVGIRDVKKRMYEENGVLVGELSFLFDSLSTVRLYRYDDNSPYMYFGGSPLSSEQLVETNGAFGADWMPVVFWPSGTREFWIKTRTQSEVTYRTPLLPHYKRWLSQQEISKKRQ